MLFKYYVTERRRRSLHRRLPSGTPCPRVRLAYSLRQPHVVYHLPTPLILTIDRATSCRLLEYIRLAATTPRLVTLDYIKLRLFKIAEKILEVIYQLDLLAKMRIYLVQYIIILKLAQGNIKLPVYKIDMYR